MKYSSKNIIGVEYIRPDTGTVLHTVLEIRRYAGSTSDLLIQRSDSEEPYLNGSNFVYGSLNSGYWKIKNQIYEIY